MNVRELHAQLTELINAGHGELPVMGYDGEYDDYGPVRTPAIKTLTSKEWADHRNDTGTIDGIPQTFFLI